jgi:hypothetical protein
MPFFPQISQSKNQSGVLTPLGVGARDNCSCNGVGAIAPLMEGPLGCAPGAGVDAALDLVLYIGLG